MAHEFSNEVVHVTVQKKGKITHQLIRQIPGVDAPIVIGKRYTGYGVIVSIVSQA